MRLILLVLGCMLAARGQAQNYDESRVPEYRLPDMLLLQDHTKIKNKAGWEGTGRKEIIRLFEDNVYGQLPQQYDSLHVDVVRQEAAAMGGRATLKEVQIRVVRGGKAVVIRLVMFIPSGNSRPVPVFLLINNRDSTNTDPSRDHKSDFWPAELLIDSGYAIAAFQVNDLAPDNNTTYRDAALRLYPEQSDAGNGMKAIGAWAWGASRVMDYFTGDKSIDAGKVALIGHSRGGKAALWAGAQDPRFAIVISNCSGNTGAALSRRKFGETVSRINTTFPYWFCDNYKKYNDHENELPVDQHMLLALIAPRPLYVGTASRDLWADPHGSFLALKSAATAFSLYGADTMALSKQPAINEALIHPPFGFHEREGDHNLTQWDWINYIKFARACYSKKKSVPKSLK